jgi:hypothetical protein
MISNRTELNEAQRQLKVYQTAYNSLCKELESEAPDLLLSTQKRYINQINIINDDIIAYLQENPADTQLKIRTFGPGIQKGSISLNNLSLLLGRFQFLIFNIGLEIQKSMEERRILTHTDIKESKKEIRELLTLNAIATAPGSFVVSLDFNNSHLLFDEYDLPEQTIKRLISHIENLSREEPVFTGNRVTLTNFDKFSMMLNDNRIRGIEISYRDRNNITTTTEINTKIKSTIDTFIGKPRQDEETVVGILISINVETNHCRIRPDGEKPVDCNYSDSAESELIKSVKKRIEVSGTMTTDSDGKRKIKNVERIRIIEEDDESNNF